MQLWQDVDDRTARLKLDRFSAQLDPRNPSAGLHGIRLDDVELAEFHLLSVDLPAVSSATDSVEHYVRGGDLIATYQDRPRPAMRAQLYWRAAAPPRPGAIAAIELLVSVQTSLLDSCPQLSAQSRLIAGEAFRLTVAAGGKFIRIVPPTAEAEPEDSPSAPCCYLFRFPQRQFSYVEMTHPADARGSNWEGWLHDGDYRLELRHALFAERLEKGVILRARVLGVLLDRKDDVAAAIGHWEAFLREALPLTT